MDKEKDGIFSENSLLLQGDEDPSLPNLEKEAQQNELQKERDKRRED